MAGAAAEIGHDPAGIEEAQQRLRGLDRRSLALEAHEWVRAPIVLNLFAGVTRRRDQIESLGEATPSDAWGGEGETRREFTRGDAGDDILFAGDQGLIQDQEQVGLFI